MSDEAKRVPVSLRDEELSDGRRWCAHGDLLCDVCRWVDGYPIEQFAANCRGDLVATFRLQLDIARAEAAAERTTAILEVLRRHDLRDCSPGYIADTIEMAFPKPGSAE